MARRLVLLAALACTACGAPEPPPNIVLVIGDDHGYPYYGFMGSDEVETPELDRLASEGTLFTRGYNTASTCRPSLRTLLTGLHPHQWTLRRRALMRQGVKRGAGSEIVDFETLPRALTRAGVATFQSGKFWEAHYTAAGFAAGTKAKRGSDFWGREAAGGAAGLEIGRSTMAPVFEFLDAHRKKPFFLWFAPQLPHSPFDASEQYLRPYDGLPESTRQYYANIARFDEALGALLRHLDETGLRDNTLVVYLSDNGWGDPKSAHVIPVGFRGKGTAYDLGFRTPVIFRWPGRVPAGRRIESRISTVDVVATLFDFAGVEIPPDRTGHSLRRVLEGRAESVRDRVIGTRGVSAPGRSPPRSAESFVWEGRWHYVWLEGLDADRLFDLEADPGEEHDVAGEHPDTVRKLRARIEAWKAQLDGGRS